MKYLKSFSVPFVLALAACGGESTPEPNTATTVTSEPPPSGATAPAETPATSGMLPSDAPQPTGTPPGGPGLSNDQMRAAGTAPPPEPAAAPAPPLTDAQVAAVADAANTGEIEQAKVAQKRAKDARVKKFAAMMVAHHSEAKQKQAKLLGKLKLKPEENPESTALTSEGTQLVETLKNVDAGSFDASYIASQVDAHQKVLTKLDAQLIPSAQNPELKASLEEFRPKVEAHLKEARDIQQALPARTSSGAAAPGGGAKGAPGNVGMSR